MRTLLLIVLAGMISGCPSSVVRNADVYQTELDFMEQAAIQPTDSLEKLLRLHCTCVNGKFENPECEDAAHKILVVRARVPWHKAMMLFNAGITNTRPDPVPPVIPAPETLCP